MKIQDFLNKEEGVVLHAYQDQAGVWTIGIGSTRYKDGSRIKQGDTITLQEAEELRDWECGNKSKVILSSLGSTKLNDNQMTALLSFTYNEGIGALLHSTLFKVVKKNPNDNTLITVQNMTDVSVKNWCEKNRWNAINIIKYHFLEYNKITVAGKHVFDEGLINRRKREADLYFSQPIKNQ